MASKNSFSDQIERIVGGTVHLTVGTAGAAVKAYGGLLGGVMEAWSDAIEKYCGQTPEPEELLPPAVGAEGLGHREVSDWSPPVDVNENDDEYQIIMDLPDVTLKDIRVTPPTVDDRLLTIRGERKQETGLPHYRVERSYGRFMRRFEIPRHVDEANVTAVYCNGVLCLHLPKKVKAIPIKDKSAPGASGMRS